MLLHCEGQARLLEPGTGMTILTTFGTRLVRCPQCGGDAFHSATCKLAPGSDNQGTVRTPEKPHELINLRFYEEEHLGSITEIFAFAAGEIDATPLSVEDFGVISREKFGYKVDAQEQEMVLFPKSGKILVCQLFGEHRHSEDTMEPANVVFTGYTPREGAVE